MSNICEEEGLHLTTVGVKTSIWYSNMGFFQIGGQHEPKPPLVPYVIHVLRTFLLFTVKFRIWGQCSSRLCVLPKRYFNFLAITSNDFRSIFLFLHFPLPYGWYFLAGCHVPACVSPSFYSFAFLGATWFPIEFLLSTALWGCIPFCWYKYLCRFDLILAFVLEFIFMATFDFSVFAFVKFIFVFVYCAILCFNLVCNYIFGLVSALPCRVSFAFLPGSPM